MGKPPPLWIFALSFLVGLGALTYFILNRHPPDVRPSGAGPEEEAPAIPPSGEAPAPVRGDDPRPEGAGPETEPGDAPRRTDRIRGVVLDDRDRPVEGARVVLVVVEEQEDASVAAGETDATGRFEIQSAGVVWPADLVAFAEGYARSDVVKGVRPDGPPIEIRLRRLLRILVSVVDDATGDPVEKSNLLLRRIGPTGEPEADALGYAVPGGQVVIPDLEKGGYLVSVTVPGYDGWTSDPIRLSREAPDATVEARVARSGPWGAVRVTASGADGTPLPRANRVYVHDPKSGFLAMTPLGTPLPVRLEAPGGRHQLYVAADGYQRTGRWVEVPPGEEAEVHVTLLAAGHVSLAVRDAEGKSVFGYRLRAFGPDGEELEYDLRVGETTETVAENGSTHSETEEAPLQGTVGRNQVIPAADAELKNLPPGRYRFVATMEGRNPAEETVDVEAGSTAKVSLILR